METAPSQIGEFRIEALLGRGGMGAVYLAYQESMRRRVALKVLDFGAHLTADDITRFEREAWVGGRLQHPNIVRVFAQGVAGTNHYIAMELIEGGSLHDEIERAKATLGSLKPQQSGPWRNRIKHMVSLFIRVVDALSYVHRSGIVHRDIKPLNLLLDRGEGRLLVTDFGLAWDEAASSLTRTGNILGTLRYMSPEQLRAGWPRVDSRSDIWSVGVSLYQAVTLEFPFPGETVEAYIHAVANMDPAPPRAKCPFLSRDLETVLLKCLQREPGERYASATLLGEDLQRLLDERPVVARRPGYALRTVRLLRRQRRLLWAALTAGTLAAAGLLTWVGLQQRERASFEHILLRMEETGETDDRSVLNQEEQHLRRSFLEGRLNGALSLRFARLLLHPELRVSAFVTPRSTYPLYASIRTSSTRWHLEAVLIPHVHLDGNALATPSVLPLGVPLNVLPPSQLEHLVPGRHRIELQLVANLFDVDDVDRLLRRWGGSPERLVGSTTADTDAVYGSHELPWSRLWPLMQRLRSAKVGPLRFPPQEFEVVGELPATFPTAIKSRELVQAMRAAYILERLDYLPSGRIRLQLTQHSPPLPFAGRLEIRSKDGVLLASDDVVILGEIEGRRGVRQGVSMMAGSPGAAFGLDLEIRWSDIEKRIGPRRASELRQALSQGERMLARMVGTREVASGTQGFNQYWDGSLDLRTPTVGRSDQRVLH